MVKSVVSGVEAVEMQDVVLVRCRGVSGIHQASETRPI